MQIQKLGVKFSTDAFLFLVSSLNTAFSAPMALCSTRSTAPVTGGTGSSARRSRKVVLWMTRLKKSLQ